MINFEKIPEDFIFEIEISNDEIISFNKNEFLNFINKENLSMSSNGVLYKKVLTDSDSNQGIIPEILTVWFNERVDLRKLAKKHGKELNDNGTVNTEYSKEKYEYYDTRQKIQKTLLNSLYGVLGLPSFRYYDLDNAVAVTSTGKDLIKFSENMLNLYLTKNYGKYSENSDENYVHYVDTDSCFLKVGDVICNKYNIKETDDDALFVNKILLFAKELQIYINSKVEIYAKKVLFSNINHLKMKQELIAKSGFWTTKKRYALMLVNKDGLSTDELEIKGLDVVRTSFPKLFAEFMTNMLKNILNFKLKPEIDSDILKLKDIISDVDVVDIARSTSIKEISKYCSNNHQPFTFNVKGAPAHVKAAVSYNDFIRFMKLDNKYSFIKDGEKIKWLYLLENPFRINALAFKNNDEDPKEILDYINKYVDRNKVFDSDMEKKLQDFYTALRWGNLPTNTYDGHFNFFN